MHIRNRFKFTSVLSVVTTALLATALLIAPAFAQDFTYKMGSSTVDVTPAIGVPLAGYGSKDRRIVPWDIFNKHRYAHFLKPSEGVLDPIRAKSMVIELGSKRVLLISLDTVGTDSSVVNEIKKFAAPLGIQHVIVSATHTHSGPGALSKNGFYAVLAMDRFVPSVYKKFINGIKQSVLEAVATLEPVRLYRTDFSAVRFQRNRRGNPEQLDPTAHLLFGRNSKNEIVGGFVNYGVHPTVLEESNLKFSADFAGGIERQMTRRLQSKNTILFINAMEGDVSPNLDGGYDEIEPKGREFADLAAAAIPAAVELPKRIEARSGNFVMPKGKLRLDNCIPKMPKWLKKLAIGGQKWFPRGYELTHLFLGDVLLMTWPGEATVELGVVAQQIAQRYGVPHAWNLGLSNGYMGYFLTEADYNEKGYEVCVSYHGPKAGAHLLGSHETLLKF
jgi:neutral ceramidase